jgi:plastocyanin
MGRLAMDMTIFSLLLQIGFSAAQSSTASAVSAAETQRVTVGATGLTFSPDTLTADEGDVIEFVISSGHSVTESNFDSPCQPISGAGIFSGFPANNAVFSVTVNSSDTLWLYCAAPGHCEAGMAMVINPP